MPKTQPLNLVLELGETNIPADPCTHPCQDKHFIIVRPKDYDKCKKTLKHGARFIGITVKAKTRKGVLEAIVEDAKRYQFK